MASCISCIRVCGTDGCGLGNSVPPARNEKEVLDMFGLNNDGSESSSAVRWRHYGCSRLRFWRRC